MSTLKMMALIDSLAGTRLSEGVDAPKNKRNRRSRLDQHIEAIHQFLFEKTKSARPHVYSLRKLAASIAKKGGKPIHHTTVLRYLKNKGLWEIFNG
jgi:transposase